MRVLVTGMGGELGTRVAQLLELVPEVDERACWQSAGVARATALVVFCTEVVNVDGPPGFGFQVVGAALAAFDHPPLPVTGRLQPPFREPPAIRRGAGPVPRRTGLDAVGEADQPGADHKWPEQNEAKACPAGGEDIEVQGRAVEQGSW